MYRPTIFCLVVTASSIILALVATASSVPLAQESENATTNETQSASIKEVSQPPMTVENASPQEYILPNYYTFNKGEPFVAEKDPLTGAIDFDKKTTPETEGKVEENTSVGSTDERESQAEAESDYFYDDQEFTDGIDRKDGSIDSPNVYRPNDIVQNPYKISPDLHQFLNLPVHYSSSDKFPLISSSYANTKVQGTGGSSSSYSNHKYATTSSTKSPSYYTMPTTRYTTPKPQYQTTVKTTTTTTTPKPTSTTTEAEEEYENTDYNEYDEEMGPAQDNHAVPSEQHTYKPDTHRYTVTTYRPTTLRFTTTTAKPRVTPEQVTTEKPKQQVSIVTSLPIDINYYSTSEDATTSTSTSSTVTPSTSASSTTAISSSYETTPIKTTAEQFSQSPLNVPTEGFNTGFGEGPFRPIFGPNDTPVKPESNNQIQYNTNDLPNTNPLNSNEFHRLPPQQNIPSIQQQQSPTLPPQMEPPRRNAPQTYFPDQPIKLSPGQHTTIRFGEAPVGNGINRPIQDIYERPPPPPLYNQDTDFRQQMPQNRPESHPVYEGRPSERPIPSVKPRPPSTNIPNKSNFKVPSKIENHFIKVSPNQENPSYSLQTSFSIGVPPTGDNKQNNQAEVPPGQGVGQVFFPDDTPAENPPVDGSLPSQVLRPPNSRPPIQSYQPNKPGYRQPIHIQPRPPPPPPPFRVPIDDLQPPSGQSDNFPRPHWEHHNSKPFYNPAQNTIPKKDVLLPQHYPGLNRKKPDNLQRSDLPNILPQFRPNAKVGHVEYHPPVNAPGEILREPLDTLQPPPLPQPQHLRINRNDDESEIDREGSLGDIKSEPLVHRRSGPQPPRVTTLQMMQNPHRKQGVRPDFPPENRQSGDKENPVFLVYPSAHGMSHKPPSEEVVVIGTRAQRPLPPAILEKDDLDSFPLDDNKQFPIPIRDRDDTPILKTKVPHKPPVKNDFPYAIVKPGSALPEERILSASSVTKEYTAYSPTPATSTEENKDHDSEINLIPYLQDYMPFATKKPEILAKPNVKKDTKLAQKPPQTNQAISTTLNASLATSMAKTTTEKVAETKTESQDKNGSEMTLSATMYTQQRPANHKIPVTYTPSEPQPVGFQAPFMASLSAPESQGWSVVTDKNIKSAAEIIIDETNNPATEDSKFDIENFKPQLFGGFKPIVPSSDEDKSADSVKDKDQDILLNKGDREERAR